MSLNLDDVGTGFADPVDDAQRCFRLILDAMSHPGRILELPADVRIADSGLPEAAAALALTVLDFETPVWLDAGCQRAAGYLRFHCGAPIVSESAAARFAFAADLAAVPPLGSFDLGDIGFPDRSTTLVLLVPELAVGTGVTLRGPGLKDSTRLRIGGVDAGFWRARTELAPLFPLGIDLVFVCGRRLAALPRTTIVETT